MGISPIPLFFSVLEALLEARAVVDELLALRLELPPVLLRFVTPPVDFLPAYFLPSEYLLVPPLLLLDALGLLWVCVLPRVCSLL